MELISMMIPLVQKRCEAFVPAVNHGAFPFVAFIFAMCQDPSPLVRVEALHVIEDAIARSVPNAHGRRFIWKATKDPDLGVRRFAKEKIKVLQRDPRKRKSKIPS